MKTLIDIRLLGRGAHSGIPIFTKEVTNRLINQGDDSFQLFYPGFQKKQLPENWAHHPRVSILDWRIPNKVLDIAGRLLNRPDISKHTNSDIILSPHFNQLNKGSLPRVLTIHDLSFAHHPHFFSYKQRFWHSLQNWRKQIYEADHLIATSHYTKNDIMQTLGIAPEAISVVYSGISNEFHPLDPHDTRLRIFQKKHSLQTPYFLYFGALEARKNITHLIQAFELLRTNPQFREYHLVLAGSPGYQAKQIVRAANQSKSSASVHILSRIADEERVLLYNGAVAFVCTSFFEGFGFPTLEAQACGVPVVASNRTSFIETLASSAVLVSPWKPTELADALMSLGTHAKIRSEFIARGIENTKRFNWDSTARQIQSILSKTYHDFYA